MSEQIVAGEPKTNGTVAEEAPGASVVAAELKAGDVDSAAGQGSQVAAVGSTLGEEGWISVDSVGGTTVDAPDIVLADASDPTRPSDEQILIYENELRAEQSKQRPLLGDRGPIDSLRSEYADSSPVFVAKVAHLVANYTGIRRTRQDGNCFYRCFIFGLLEALLIRGDPATNTLIIQSVKDLEGTLETAGITKLVWEDAMEILLELLNAVSNPQERITAAELLVRLNSEDVCNMLVMFVRFVASAHIFTREDHFLPFILGTMDNCTGVDDFRRRYVEVMGEESDHIQCVALAEAFRVPIEVIYLDNSPGEQVTEGVMACNKHLLEPPEPLQGAEVPTVSVLYRPGHYDLLY